VAFWIGLLTQLGVAATALYAVFVEPYWIEVTRHVRAGGVQTPLRIAHLSDLHTKGFGARERQVIELVQAAAPDLVVITGDTVDEGSLEPGRELLRQLRAPLGVWVVRGHRERDRPVIDERRFFESLGVRFLDNQGVALRDDVWLVGLDDPATGRPDLPAALVGAPTASFKLALFHAPDHFPDVAGLFHLGLAGHTHGGQVRLPVIGPLWLPPGGRRFLHGWYTQNRSELYVSRGIGTSRYPARLFCRPELAIIEIRPH
jgi:predicted MPP superfamily phosphohydrolase